MKKVNVTLYLGYYSLLDDWPTMVDLISEMSIIQLKHNLSRHIMNLSKGGPKEIIELFIDFYKAKIFQRETDAKAST